MKILYTADQVTIRITEMAQELIDTYHHDKPLFVCLLKGAVPFTSQLMTVISQLDPDFHPEVEYMHVSAYGENRNAGHAKIFSGIDSVRIDKRHIIVLDDCLDQGVTYQAVEQQLQDWGAASVELVVLADKQTNVPNRATPLISGFKVPDVWLVGMGMDDAAAAPEAQRWAEYIGSVSSGE